MIDTSNISIYPCKCGGEPFVAKVIITVGNADASYFVQCKECGEQSEFQNTPAEAIFDWNDRIERAEGDFPKLKPCPFCGHELEMSIDTLYAPYAEWVIGCSNPECVIHYQRPKRYETKRENIEAWNRRVGE